MQHRPDQKFVQAVEAELPINQNPETGKTEYFDHRVRRWFKAGGEKYIKARTSPGRSSTPSRRSA